MNSRSSLSKTLAFAAWCLVAALARASPSWAICVTDDSGVEICLDAAPTRIISLYGAFTEILWEIGAGETLVARTKNDTTIPEVAELPSVGTGLRPNVEYLLALRPDLVVGRSSRAARQGLTAIRDRGLRIAGFDPKGFADAYSTIRRLGTLTGRGAQADELVKTIEAKVARVVDRTAALPRRLRVVYEVRSTPLTVAGAGGLVDEIIRAAGGTNAATNPKKLFMLDVEALLRLDPDVYIVQEGPMNRNPSPPAERPHLGNLRAVREGRVLTVDEKIFSRPGPRLAQAVEQLCGFLYPELWPLEPGTR